MERIILPILLCLAAGAAIGGAIYFARNGISARAKRILLGLVAEAECYFGEGTGSIKFSAVLGRLYSQMPAVMQLLFKHSPRTSLLPHSSNVLLASMQT